MNKLILWGLFAYILQGCGSSTSSNSTEDDSEFSVAKSSKCYITYNLQVGEKVTYRFDIKGDVSYMSAEVINENNESYTIAFSEEGEETENYQWLKECQSSSTLQAISQNPKAKYILTGGLNLTNYDSLSDNLNSQQDTLTNTIGTYHETEEWFEEYTLESQVYKNVERIFTEYSSESTIAYDDTYIYNGEILGGVNLPFLSHLKDVIGFWDDTNITIELIEWNGL